MVMVKIISKDENWEKKQSMDGATFKNTCWKNYWKKNFEECNNLKALKFNTWKLNKMQYNWNWWPNDPVTHWNWTKLGILMVFGHLRLCWINSITDHHSWFQKIQKIRNWLIFFFQIFENVDNRLCCVIFSSWSSSSYHLVMNKTMRINDFEMHGFIALHRSLP